MLNRIILIKYGELTTKKANRNLFINTLHMNIMESLKDYDVKIEKTRVRMFIIPNNESDFDIIVNKLKKIFGIHSIVIAYYCDNNIDNIKNHVLDIVKDIKFNTFKVETKRSNKNFPIHSQDFNRVLGGLILKNIDNIKVDVHNPDLWIKVEIRENDTYIYYDYYDGRGGYPLGTQARGMETGGFYQI